ncbi:hypothetical protein F0562_007522 [Nyssa sinensis]|uniref:Transmembrane protein n=1 Tax=Nyssa sinensis TaxID=561372 RepID=A0A5J5A8G6_9ASTE|nr:hypothetical protein F0562_007522 [Nyssa sinensis]
MKREEEMELMVNHVAKHKIMSFIAYNTMVMLRAYSFDKTQQSSWDSYGIISKFPTLCLFPYFPNILVDFVIGFLYLS